MATLDSKVARIGLQNTNAASLLVRQTMEDYAAHMKSDGLEVEIEIRLVASSASSSGKAAARSVLDVLIARYVTSGWSDSETHTLFDFKQKVYHHHDNEIYLTEGEQLFLYRALVVRDPVARHARGFINTLRTKFGRDFLKGFI